jgi:hypothetical protein
MKILTTEHPRHLERLGSGRPRPGTVLKNYRRQIARHF